MKLIEIQFSLPEITRCTLRNVLIGIEDLILIRSTNIREKLTTIA